jgi:hypothetical protein
VSIDELARQAAYEVDTEWQLGGLTGGIYEDFAVAVCEKVAVMVRAQALEDAIHIVKMHQFRNGYHQFTIGEHEHSGGMGHFDIAMYDAIRALK